MTNNAVWLTDLKSFHLRLHRFGLRLHAVTLQLHQHLLLHRQLGSRAINVVLRTSHGTRHKRGRKDERCVTVTVLIAFILGRYEKMFQALACTSALPQRLCFVSFFSIPFISFVFSFLSPSYCEPWSFVTQIRGDIAGVSLPSPLRLMHLRFYSDNTSVLLPASTRFELRHNDCGWGISAIK